MLVRLREQSRAKDLAVAANNERRQRSPISALSPTTFRAIFSRDLSSGEGSDG